MLDDALLAAVLRDAIHRGASFAEVYVERWKRRSMRVHDGAVKEASSGIEYGAGLRLFYGTEVAYAYTNDLTPEGLKALTESLTSLRAGAGRVDTSGRGGLDFRKIAPRGLHRPGVLFDARPKSYRVERLLEADAAARALAPQIRTVDASLREWDQEVLVANSDGDWTQDRRVRARLAVQAIAAEGPEVQTGLAYRGLSVGLEILDIAPPAVLGRAAAEQAMTNLRAGPAPAGTMPVVIGNAFGGVLFHEAVGHLLETTSVARKTSVLSDRLGDRVASPIVTYIDDGTIRGAWGSSEFDDECASTERTTLIERGELKSYMVDRWGGMLTGYRPTGSGRRQDYTFAPTSRMRNTFIAPGTSAVDDLIGGVDLGLYAKTMRGGQVKPGSGEYNFGVQEAYMIRGGKIAEPVRGAMLLGKGPDTIMRIEGVAGDLASESGMCGSMSGSLPTEVGQPHVLVSQIVVGGEAR
jgi:TldD protein